MLKKFLNYIYKNRLIILISLGVFLFFYFGEFSFAGNEGGNTSVTQDNQSISNTIKLADGVFVFIASMLGIMTQLVGVFLNPNWTNGAVFGLTENLHELWILVSNVVYFIFVLILIIIAFLNIIGQGKGVFELKQALPRLIIGILMVPFSWLLIQAILSVSAVLTASVLTIPFDTFENTLPVKNLLEADVCVDGLVTQTKQVKKNENQQGNNQAVYTTHNEEGKQVTYYCKHKIKAREILNSPHGVYGILNIYTYGIMALDETMKTYSQSLGDKITTLFSLLTKLGFDLIFILVYAILVIALFFALFIRGIWLWIYMIFSPVFGLLIFFGKGTTGFGDGGDKFNIKELVSLAMVPVYVAGALSFGLLFIIIAGQGMKAGVVDLINITNNADKTSTLNVLGTFKFTLDGDFANAANIKATNSFNQLFAGGFGIIGTIILQIFGLLVLWIGVMAALRASKITANITEPIRNFGKQTGELLMNAPKYIPLPGTNISLGSVTKAGSQTIGAIENLQNQKAAALSKSMQEALHIIDEDRDKMISAANHIYTKLKGGNTVDKDILANIKKMVGFSKNLTNLSNSEDSVKALAETLKKLDIQINGKTVTAQDLYKNDSMTGEALKELEKKIESEKSAILGDGIFAGINTNKGSFDSTGGINNLIKELHKNVSTSSGKSSSSGDSTKYNNLLNAQVVSETRGLNKIKLENGKEVRVETTGEKIIKGIDDLANSIKNKFGEKISKKQLNDIMKGFKAEASIVDIEKKLKDKGVKVIDHTLNINTITSNKNTDENKIEIVFKNKTGGNTIIGAEGGELNEEEIKDFVKYLNYIKENGESFTKEQLKTKLEDMGINESTIKKIISKI